MLSGTSFFNRSLYLQILRRCWPLWAGFLGVNLFVFPGNLSGFLQNLVYSGDRNELLPSFLKLDLFNHDRFLMDEVAGLSLVMAGLTAAVCFMWIFHPRSAGFHLSLPVRREGQFVSHYLAGLTMLLVPLLVACAGLFLVAGGHGISHPGALLSWLGSYAALSLFFYSLAVFCAMLAGHVLAMGAFYGLLNLLSAGLYALTAGYLSRTIYGASFSFGAVQESFAQSLCFKLSPIFWLTGHREGAGGYLWLLALAGLLLSALSLALFRRRRAESAGEVTAIRRLRPVFLYTVTFGMALIGVSSLLSIFLPPWRISRSTPLAPLFAVLSAALGFFLVSRLLHKSVRGWRRRKKGLILSLTLVLLLSVALEFDWSGAERWRPDPGEVVSVSVRMEYMNAGVFLERPDSLALTAALHREIVEHLDTGASYYTAGKQPPYGPTPPGVRSEWVELSYTLRDGSRRLCGYSVWGKNTDGLFQRIAALCAAREYRDGYFYRPGFTRDKISGVSVTLSPTDEEAWPMRDLDDDTASDAARRALYDALYEDVAAGHIPAHSVSGSIDNSVWVSYDTGAYTDGQIVETLDNSRYYYLTPECVATLEALRALGIEITWPAD